MYYVTAKYKRLRHDELWYREFKDINEAYDFKLILKMYNSLIFDDTYGYSYIKIRENLYSNNHGFFDKRISDGYKVLMIGDIRANYLSRMLPL